MHRLTLMIRFIVPMLCNHWIAGFLFPRHRRTLSYSYDVLAMA